MLNRKREKINRVTMLDPEGIDLSLGNHYQGRIIAIGSCQRFDRVSQEIKQ